jgi:peptidoglycan hydrolase CwlO-like protein
VRPSPLLSAAAAAALLAAVAGPATAATEPAPAKGVASSAVTLLGVTAGGHTLTAGTIELLSDMLGPEAVAKILVTPLTADGTAYGQQTVTPAESPFAAPAVDSSALVPALAGIASLRTPVLNATAGSANGEPSTSARADSLGGLDVLGLPVSLAGTVDIGSVVTKAGGAVGEKTIVVENVALPSIADVLNALGLDLSVLPIDVLNELVTALDLVNPAIDDAQKALDEAKKAIQAKIDTAQAEVDKAGADLAAALNERAGKESELAKAEQDLAAKTAQLNDAKAALADAQADLATAVDTQASAQQTYDSAYAAVKAAADLLGMTVATYVATFPTLDIVVALKDAAAALDAANAAVSSATAAVDQAVQDVATAQSAVDLAQAAVETLKAAIAALQATIDALQAALDAAIAALNDLLDQVQKEISALLGAITAVLDGTPLVSFDSLKVITEATATSNQEGGQSAQIVGGEISGLEVLGTDVLSDVLGTTSIDLLELVGTQLTAVNGLVSELTGTLSDVLSTVPQFPTLSVPAPEIGLLTKSTSTDIVDGFGVASTSVQGLSITLPSVSIPTALALPGAAELPALAGVTQVAGLLTSAPVRLELATLSSNARFAGTATAAPGTGTPGTGTGTPGTGPVPQLPRTGASELLAVVAIALMGAAYAARRRRVAEELDA